MKYLLQTFGADEEQPSPAADAMARMIQQMKDIDVRLRSAGELVVEQGLDAPGNGWVVTDSVRRGSHARTADSVQGFWIVDVDTEQRALDIAREISSIAFGAPVEVRLCLDAPPPRDGA
ncbi:YciI family protein [Arthrobacter agilis]|jgi:hypothetical protein|uniref:YciI family protein n=1 Tax=Arthrobacter agilis TaxID=37921 RepID=UPI00278B3E2C|nr:YciI family protein [Arthrobacter agilis]MDQ0735975.1 hypothetical protein [Arthrobacter agilis]